MTTRSNDIHAKAKAALTRAAAVRDLREPVAATPLYYEVWIDTGPTSLTRFATALLTTRCVLSPRKLRLTCELGRGITQYLIVEFADAETAERFRERCKPLDMLKAKVATPGGGMKVARLTQGDE
jgi:hypothetical protein